MAQQLVLQGLINMAGTVGETIIWAPADLVSLLTYKDINTL